MKWEDYNRMSNRQKEEYNYRFKNHSIVIDIRGLAFIVIIMYLLVMVMISLSYIVITDEVFVAYRDDVLDILTSSNQFILVGVVLILLIAIVHIIDVFVWVYKEKKWIKQNNIVITHTNILRKMFRSRR